LIHLANLFQIACGVDLRGGGASVAKDADDRLVVFIAGSHLNQECCARYIIGAGEIAIHREIIQLPSVKGLTAPAGKEIELDAARSIDGHRKSDLCEGGADVDWTDVFPLVGIWLKL